MSFIIEYTSSMLYASRHMNPKYPKLLYRNFISFISDRLVGSSSSVFSCCGSPAMLFANSFLAGQYLRSSTMNIPLFSITAGMYSSDGYIMYANIVQTIYAR